MLELAIVLLQLSVFLIISGGIFSGLGFLIIGKEIKILAKHEILAVSLCMGVVIFVFLTILLGFLKLRFLMLPLIICLTLYSFFKYRKALLSPWKVFIENKLLSLMLIVAILINGFIDFPSGYKYNSDLLFWSSQGHDGLWQISLMSEISKNIPPNNPVFAGTKLYNYHYLVDVLMGEFHRIFPMFSNLDLYFRFFPVVFSILIGLTVFSLMTRWKKNQTIGYLGLFFTYFTGSFGYIVTYLHGGNIFGGETVFWAAQENTLLGNPPHATSHFLLVATLFCLLVYLQTRKNIWLLYTFILGSFIAGFKVSGGFVMLAGIVFASIIDFLNYRKIRFLLTALLLSLTNFLTFKAMTSPDAATFLVFMPWWFIRTMVVSRLDWVDWELRRQLYVSKNTWHAWLRVIENEGIAFSIFLVGNLGMRVIGFYKIVTSIFKEKIYKNTFEIVLLVIMVVGFIVPLFFIQKGIVYNSIQFMQYFLLIFGFYAAVSFYKLFSLSKNKVYKIILLVILAVFSMPTVIGNLNEFYGPHRTALAKISMVNQQALAFMKNNSQPEDVILTLPFDENLKKDYKLQPQPWPIYIWDSTSYISALTDRPTYLTAEELGLIMGYEPEVRLNQIRKFFLQTDFAYNLKFLKDGQIKYLYIEKPVLKQKLDLVENHLTQIFENNEVVIYRVNNS